MSDYDAVEAAEARCEAEDIRRARQGVNVHAAAQDILVSALAEAQDLLAHSDVSSSKQCCDVESRLATFQDLLQSGCAELRLTGRAVLALGDRPTTVSALDQLRSKWKG